MPEIDFRAPRLFVDAGLAAGATVELERSQSNYLGNVLRLAGGRHHPGVQRTRWRMAGLDRGRKRPDSLTITSPTRPQDRLPDLAYVFAPLKHARLDYMVQKAVEMGVSPLQPVLTRFTQVARVNSERMRANVIEAAEQCGILSVASVAEPVTLDRYLGQRDAERLLVFCDEDAEVADPLAARCRRKAGVAARDRHPDRSGRRICRGRARHPAAPAADAAAFAGTPDAARRHRRRGGAGAGAGRARRLDRSGR